MYVIVLKFQNFPVQSNLIYKVNTFKFKVSNVKNSC